jgi:MoxR-like ATPase
MEIEHLNAEAFRPRSDLKYTDVFKLHDLYEKAAFSANLILVGPKGVGKSLSIAAWAAKHEHPVITFDCSEDVRRPHLIGYPVLRGDVTPFVLGPLTTAFQVANEAGRAILNLEEINALTPQMQKILNAVTDWRARVEVPEAKRVFALKEGAKLWVTGTMNTAVYGGVYSLNEDLKSRFRIIPLDYPTKEQEIAILKDTLPNIDVKKLTNALTLAHETRQRALDYAMSTRDVVQLLVDIEVAGIDKALWMLSGKFEGNDRAFFVERCVSIFGVKLHVPKG